MYFCSFKIFLNIDNRKREKKIKGNFIATLGYDEQMRPKVGDINS